MTTTPIIVQQTVSRAEFAQMHGVHPDTVKGWLAQGKVQGATKDSSGKWQIPADATLLIGNGAAPSTAVQVHAPAPVPDLPPAEEPKATASEKWGEVHTLNAIAEEMGVTRGTVERLLAAGLLPGTEIKGDQNNRAIYLPPTKG